MALDKLLRQGSRLNIPQWLWPWLREREGVKGREDYLCCRLDFLCSLFCCSNQSYSVFTHSCLCDFRVSQNSTPLLDAYATQQYPSCPFWPLLFLFLTILWRIFSAFFTLNFLSRRLIHCMNRIFPNWPFSYFCSILTS